MKVNSYFEYLFPGQTANGFVEWSAPKVGGCCFRITIINLTTNNIIVAKPEDDKAQVVLGYAGIVLKPYAGVGQADNNSRLIFSNLNHDDPPRADAFLIYVTPVPASTDMVTVVTEFYEK